MTDILLVVIVILLVMRLYQARQQHIEMIEIIDHFAEMIAERTEPK